MDLTARVASPLGELVLAGRGEALTGLWFRGQAHFGEGLDPDHRPGSLPVLEAGAAWLERYFRGLDPGPPPPLAPRGTAYQQAVWALLLEIPRGETRTYGALARLLGQRQGRPTSPRALAGAVARNPISILIPCHRVVGAAGLTGYAGGLDRKQFLLSLERF